MKCIVHYSKALNQQNKQTKVDKTGAQDRYEVTILHYFQIVLFSSCKF